MTDTYKTLANGTSIQYGPRKDDGTGNMIPCPKEEAQVWGMYLQKPDQIGHDWIADCVSESAAVCLTFGLQCAYGPAQ
ncbi:hypothetical protein [Stenotrophomonas maltophilia]|mgnify:CR=1 FL=1|uniref:hypothetical protein n=1 Tax=Stenotrophomonas maltophilia TaxID=40324 RepID=UPI0020913EE8|nr:hypothetical protein [Stenotrophomonas maltophilia]MCO5735909.1 hypothetical protein [Stenotrophomonas maltophilia]